MTKADREEVQKMLDESLEKALAVFAGQIMRHVDQRATQTEESVNAQLGDMHTTLDNLAARVADDDVEPAAIISEQRRHGRRIKELATSKKTKLTPIEEL